MCLIAFALGVVPGYPLLIAANRDEHLDRPTLPLHAWQLDNGTPVVAGCGRPSGMVALAASAMTSDRPWSSRV